MIELNTFTDVTIHDLIFVYIKFFYTDSAYKLNLFLLRSYY